MARILPDIVTPTVSVPSLSGGFELESLDQMRALRNDLANVRDLIALAKTKSIRMTVAEGPGSEIASTSQASVLISSANTYQDKLDEQFKFMDTYVTKIDKVTGDYQQSESNNSAALNSAGDAL